jgi:hypothetical protein
VSERVGLDMQDFAGAFRRFVDAMTAEAALEESPLLRRLREHLGAEPSKMPIVAEEFESYEHPNVQVALDAVLGAPGRRAELVGIAVQNKRFMTMTLSDLLAGGHPWGRFAEGPADFVNFHLEDDRVLPCVQFGVFFVWSGEDRLALFVAGPTNPEMGPRVRMRVEVVASHREIGAAFLRELTAEMRQRDVYRGKVISLEPSQFGVQGLVRFHRLPRIGRDDVVLPDGLLDRIERETIGFAAHAQALLAARQPLRRGILLYGPPGTGKTLTVMYLISEMPNRTVILTTGINLGLISSVGRFGRRLAPATVVVEDVDLIAQERGLPGVPTQPLLFELLNQMDGLGDDVDVLFVLTTNRPDILEPALAARPGRVDLVAELPLPDARARRRLLELYARGLTLEGVDLGKYVEPTDGASPAYIKELLRKAALLAAIDADGAQLKVREDHLSRAMEELAAGGELAKRIVGFGGSAYLPPSPSVGPMRPAGFPETVILQRRG